MIGERGEWGALNAARTGLPLHPSDVCVLGIQRGRCACIEGTEERMCVHCGEYVYLHASGAHVYIGGTKGIDIARFPSQFTDQDSLTT